MKKIILTTTAILLVLAGLFSCEKEEPVALAGTDWNLVGIVDVNTGKRRDLSPRGRNPHIFHFNSDNTASEVHEVNPAHLELSPKTHIYISPYTDIPMEDEFYDIIDGVNAYELKGHELKLFYNNKKNYLLYYKLVYY